MDLGPRLRIVIRRVVVWRAPLRGFGRDRYVRPVLHEMDRMKRRRRSTLAAGGLGAVLACVAAFALVNSSSTATNQRAGNPRPALSLHVLKKTAGALDRPRGPQDVLPPQVAELLSRLPGNAPGAAEKSMRVLAADGVGGLYVAPLSDGFAILSTVGFAGMVPNGLSNEHPLVGGSATRPDGRLVLLGIASDDVADVVITARAVEYAAHRTGNGFWWLSRDQGLGPDDVAISARMNSGRILRVS
jgi:hypothetical protein